MGGDCRSLLRVEQPPVAAGQTASEPESTRSGALRTQVLQELLVNIRRKTKHPLSTAETLDLLSDYLRWEGVVNTADSTVEAFDLEARYQVSFWDALIIHAAYIAGATILFSEDLSDGQRYGSIRVVNPFNADARLASIRRIVISMLSGLIPFLWTLSESGADRARRFRWALRSFLAGSRSGITDSRHERGF
jgi:predicted nucleic acid-binding protein